MKKSAVAIIREQLGLTQQELADYLDIERGTLSMAESNRRPISTAILAELTQLFQQPATVTGFISSEWEILEQAEMVKEFSAHKKELEWKIAVQKRNLARLQAKHNQCIAKIQAFKKMHLLLENVEITPLVVHKKAWLKQAEIKTWKIFSNCSKTDMALLSLSIQTLEGELIAVNQRLVGEQERLYKFLKNAENLSANGF